MDQHETRLFTDQPPGIPREASAQASCFWCETLHPAPHPLSVCSGCAATARAARFPMGSLGMDGSYPLTAEAIDATLTRTSPGNYALGYMDDGTFMVFYVGRSDSDVKLRLHEWVGAPSQHDRFTPSSRAAWGVHRRGLLPLDVSAPGRAGVETDSSYTRFAYSYAPSADAAFAKQWRNYDDFGGSDGLDNAMPPTRRRSAPEELRA